MIGFVQSPGTVTQTNPSPLATRESRSAPESRRFRIASHPYSNIGNPYVDLFYQALSAHGIERSERMEFRLKWLAERAHQIDAVHIHWPETLWRGRPRGRLDRWTHTMTAGGPRRVLRLKRFLRLARQLGIKSIWTVHNLGHHEGADDVDMRGYRTLAENCDVLIAHSRWAAEQVREKFAPDAEIVVMRHGTYAGVYPEPRTREDIIDHFGLKSERPVIGCVGILRKYKGIELACDAARLLGDRVQLVVAGKPMPSADRPYWRNLLERYPETLLIDRMLEHQEFVDVLSVSDVALLPYTNITGSGALLAAWTMGTGVVASDLPYFREMLDGQAKAGKLFRRGSATDLAEAIATYVAIPREERVAAVLRAAQAHSWDCCIEPVVRVIERWRDQDSQN